MKKLAELGSTSAWVTWLKETFERHEVENRDILPRRFPFFVAYRHSAPARRHPPLTSRRRR